jgi:uncharacterized membrane protein YtjA (UPF0391 family)
MPPVAPRPTPILPAAHDAFTEFCEEPLMLSWAVAFLVVAVIAAVLGFGVIAGTAALLAKVAFFVFLVLFVVSLVLGRRRI